MPDQSAAPVYRSWISSNNLVAHYIPIDPCANEIVGHTTNHGTTLPFSPAHTHAWGGGH